MAAIEKYQRSGWGSLDDEQRLLISSHARPQTGLMHRGLTPAYPGLADDLRVALRTGRVGVGDEFPLPTGGYSANEGMARAHSANNPFSRKEREIIADMHSRGMRVVGLGGKQIQGGRFDDPTDPHALDEFIKSEQSKIQQKQDTLDVIRKAYPDDKIKIRVAEQDLVRVKEETDRAIEYFKRDVEELKSVRSEGNARSYVFSIEPGDPTIKPGAFRVTGVQDVYLNSNGKEISIEEAMPGGRLAYGAYKVTRISGRSGQTDAVPISSLAPDTIDYQTGSRFTESEILIPHRRGGGMINRIQRFADGGKVLADMLGINGPTYDSPTANTPIVPGVGNTDTVPAALTPGEFVVNKQATAQNIDLLQAINSGNIVSANMGRYIPKYGRGGKIPGISYLVGGGQPDPWDLSNIPTPGQESQPMPSIPTGPDPWGDITMPQSQGGSSPGSFLRRVADEVGSGLKRGAEAAATSIGEGVKKGATSAATSIGEGIKKGAVSAATSIGDRALSGIAGPGVGIREPGGGYSYIQSEHAQRRFQELRSSGLSRKAAESIILEENAAGKFSSQITYLPGSNVPYLQDPDGRMFAPGGQEVDPKTGQPMHSTAGMPLGMAPMGAPLVPGMAVGQSMPYGQGGSGGPTVGYDENGRPVDREQARRMLQSGRPIFDANQRPLTTKGARRQQL